MSDSAPLVIVAVDDLLGHAAAEGHVDLGVQVLARVGDAVGVGRRQGHAERHAARDDRDLAHRVGPGREHPHERVPGLVVGGPFAVRRARARSRAASRAGSSRASR